jgi:hypothetical protein
MKTMSNTTDTAEQFATSPCLAIEWHYAPMTGVLGKWSNGKWWSPKDWAEHHENMKEFMRLRSEGEIVLTETVNYGHSHFHGHSGRVDVYAPNNELRDAMGGKDHE